MNFTTIFVSKSIFLVLFIFLMLLSKFMDIYFIFEIYIYIYIYILFVLYLDVLNTGSTFGAIFSFTLNKTLLTFFGNHRKL